VILKKDSSIWYNTVARADINRIIIGERSNVQDNSVIHLENDQGVIVGDDVTIGHNAIIHGWTIEDGAVI
jgi:carbonic anhydrase/acetyltransferase-like protein (isoleucine patch superfamily)